MRLGDIGRQDGQYRRGLVLGLTVAEAMLLILFALLLALGAILLRRDNFIATLRQQLAEATHQTRLAEAKAEVLQAIAEKRPNEDFVRELVRAREQQAQNEAEQKKLEERERSVRKDEETIKALNGSTDKDRRVKDLAALGARLERETAKTSPETNKSDLFDVVPQAAAAAAAAQKAGYTPEQARNAFKEGEKQAREIATLKGQVANLRNDLSKIGRGGDYPPCWVTPAGKIEFIFDIELGGDGQLRVRDTTPPARLLDRRELAIPPSLFGSELSPARFLSLTEPLYAYEKAKDCRFFVTVGDLTSDTQKITFKNLLLTVEARFYKVLRRG